MMMMMMGFGSDGDNLNHFEAQFLERMRLVCQDHPDPSHDLLHVERVVQNARRSSQTESAQLEIVVPAAYLHDVVYISKADPRRKEASRLSAEEARTFLLQIRYPEKFIDGICHAISAHSFSAGQTAETIEAKVVQDADRLDALGAIGIARCMAFSGLTLRPLYEKTDPFCTNRSPNDASQALDHFFAKLLKLPQKMQTESGRLEALGRVEIMQSYLEAFRQELAF